MENQERPASEFAHRPSLDRSTGIRRQLSDDDMRYQMEPPAPSHAVQCHFSYADRDHAFSQLCDSVPWFADIVAHRSACRYGNPRLTALYLGCPNSANATTSCTHSAS